MTRHAQPPLIIFFDLLFVFLFVIYLDSRNLTIDLPNESLFVGATLVYFEKEKQNYRLIDGSPYIPNRDYTYLLPCDNDIPECQQASNQHGMVFIVFPKKLQSEISELSLMAQDTGTCTNLRLSLTLEGHLNYKQMVQNNPCLKVISGYEKLLEPVHNVYTQ